MMQIKQFIKWIIVYGLVVFAVIFGLGLLSHGNPILGGMLIAVAALTSIIASHRWNHRAAMQAESLLAEMLPSRGYRELAINERKMVSRLLKGTFVDEDFALIVHRTWIRSADPIAIFWCRYGTSGEGIESNIAAVVMIESREMLEFTRIELRIPPDSPKFNSTTAELFRDHQRRPLGRTPMRFQLRESRLVCKYEPELAGDYKLGESVRVNSLQEIVDSLERFIAELYAKHVREDRLEE